MTQRPLVAVLFGGRSSEHSVSCVTAAGVMNEIDPNAFRLLPIGITQEGKWRVVNDWKSFAFDRDNMPQVADNQTEVFVSPSRNGSLIERDAQGAFADLGSPDIVFPLLHGKHGEDGAMQGLLTLLDAPFVGPGVFASAAGMDKHFTKMVLRAAGIPTAEWKTVTLTQYNADPNATIDSLQELGLPAFVKPSRAGSSVGISKVSDTSGFKAALDDAFAHDTKVIVEPFIDGREIECAVLGSVNDAELKASSPGEITVSGDHEFYDFDAKYLDLDATTLTCPADVEPDVAEQVREIACQTFRAFDCSGLTRVDTFVRPNGEVLVNEINTSPGFTPSSGYPVMWQNSGLPYRDLITELLTIAVEDHKRATTA